VRESIDNVGRTVIRYFAHKDDDDDDDNNNIIIIIIITAYQAKPFSRNL